MSDEQAAAEAAEAAEAAQAVQQDGLHMGATPAPAPASSSSSAALTPRELRSAAEVVLASLQRAGIGDGVRLMQLSYGDYIVLLPKRRGQVAAVVPAAPTRVTVNAPRQPLGSALVAQRVLAARGAVAVLASSEVELLSRCSELLRDFPREGAASAGGLGAPHREA